jgi:hypothetical protein
VKDAGAELTDLITRMKAQKGFRAVEIVVVDSGSTDGSAETAEALGATVVRIRPEEFSHSHARNLGAARATGDWMEHVPNISFLGLGFGQDPTSVAYGATVFDAGSGTHSEYFKPGSLALRNLSLIALGRAA